MNDLLAFLLDLDRLSFGNEDVSLGFERPIPGWGWALVVAGALALAVWSYSRLIGPRYLRGLLAVARAGLLVLLVLLVTGPKLVQQTETVEKDWILVLLDRSVSMTIPDAPGAAGASRARRRWSALLQADDPSSGASLRGERGRLAGLRPRRVRPRERRRGDRERHRTGGRRSAHATRGRDRRGAGARRRPPALGRRHRFRRALDRRDPSRIAPASPRRPRARAHRGAGQRRAGGGLRDRAGGRAVHGVRRGPDAHRRADRPRGRARGHGGDGAPDRPRDGAHARRDDRHHARRTSPARA